MIDHGVGALYRVPGCASKDPRLRRVRTENGSELRGGKEGKALQARSHVAREGSAGVHAACGGTC